MKALAVAALILVSLIALGAQAPAGTITGVVLDASGARIPGVTVTATHATTLDVKTAITDVEGRYTFSNLPVGAYDVTAALPGFATRRAAGLIVGASVALTQNFSLALQGVQYGLIPPPSPYDRLPPVTITANRQTTTGDVTAYRGNVQMTINNAVLQADELDFNSLTQHADVRGNVSVQLRPSGPRVIPLSKQ